VDICNTYGSKLEGCYRLKKTNYIRISTVTETLGLAGLSNESYCKQLDCDKGLVVSNNSPYTLLQIKITAAFDHSFQQRNMCVCRLLSHFFI
jgi:hypothetical protein